MKKRIILFDIDHTLFDAALYRDKWLRLLADKLNFSNREEFADLANTIYMEIRKTMNFEPTIFVEKLIEQLHLTIKPQELESIILNDKLIESCLYDEAEQVLKALSKDPQNMIGVFSGGRHDLQTKKIQNVLHLFHKDHIHIIRNKKDLALKDILLGYANYKIFLIDDMLKMLYSAKSLDKAVVTVWSVRGRFAKNQVKIDNFRPDYAIGDLTELLQIVKNEN